MNSFFPKQRLTYAEKAENDWEYVKNLFNSIVTQHDEDFCLDCGNKDKNNVGRVRRMLSNYRLFNNILDQEDFKDYCDTLGIKAEIGAVINDIKPYNKTYNKINVLLGEEYKRPDNQRVVLVNPEGIRSKLEYKKKLYREYFDFMMQEELLKAKQQYPELDPAGFKSQEEYNQAMQQQEQEIQQRAEQVLPPAEIEKYMSTSYLHSKEIMASHLLNYLMYKENIKEKKNDGFKHGNISGEEHVWVGVINGAPVCELLNSPKVFFHKSPEVKYIQDGMYAGYRTNMTMHDILTRFCDELTDDQKDLLEERHAAKVSGDKNLIGHSMKYGDQETLEYKYAKNRTIYEGSYGPSLFDDIEVIHMEWVSQRKVGFVSYTDDNGQPVEVKVDESFTIPKQAIKTTEKEENGEKITVYQWDKYSLEWEWIPEVWEAIRIDGDIFINIGPKRHQYYSPNNPYKVKLGYHGICYNNMNAASQSTMDRMKAAQYLYFIAMDRFKTYIAKDKGKVMPIDSSRLDPRFPIEKTIHFLEQSGYYVYNGLQGAEMPGASTRAGLDAQDLSTMQYIINFAQILSFLDKEIGDAAGVTTQREGGVAPYEAVTNTQQSIVQSSYITEPTFIAHENLWREVKQSLIQVAQIAYSKNPMITQYILNDGSRVILEIDENLFEDNTEFGIFVSDNAKDSKIFDELRALTQPLIQSDRALMTDIINILSASSVEELKRELKASEEQRFQREQQSAQAQQQHEKELQAMQQQVMEDQQAHQIELQRMKDETAILVAQISAESKMDTSEPDVNIEMPDMQEMQKMKMEQAHDKAITSMELSHESSEAQKARMHEAKQKEADRKHEAIQAEKDRKVKQEDIAAKKQIARSRPKPSK